MEKPVDSITILIVDDHPIMRVGIAAILNAQPRMRVVGQAGTATEAIRLYETLLPDVHPHGSTPARPQRRRGDSGYPLHLARCQDRRSNHLQGRRGHPSGHRGRCTRLSHQGNVPRGLGAGPAKSPRRTSLPPRVISEALSSRIPGSILSHREQEVLQLMFAGKSNREIAEDLAIKEATVKSHVSVILMRMNVNDRTQAVIEGLKRGLVHL